MCYKSRLLYEDLLNRFSLLLLAPFLSSVSYSVTPDSSACVAGVVARIGPTQPVGSSAALSKLLQEVDRAAPLEMPILILGETGSGKELIAERFAHRGNRNEKFLTVNMAAIPESLAESLLFGHEKGAFTGASARHAGIFEQADGGTVFLDEFGEASLDTQARLLRVLEGKPFNRVGGNELIAPKVRVVLATHRDLVADVQAGRFRQDLYYRISALSIRIPPLRERLEDIGELANHFVHALHGKEPSVLRATEISPEAVARLKTHVWPGNIRELENVITRAMLNCEGTTIQVSDLPEMETRFDVPGVFTLGGPGSTTVPAHLVGWLQNPGSLRDGVNGLEAHAIIHLLRKYEGNRGQVAEHLGIARAALRTKMRLYELGYVDGRVVFNFRGIRLSDAED